MCRRFPESPSRCTSVDEAKAIAEQFGYPVAIKAAHGGGGKGLRVVHGPDDLADAFEGARREADAYFENPEVYVEKYLEQPRHVEAQILFDSPRQRGVPRRTRLLDAETAPEADRGDPLPGPHDQTAQGPGQGRAGRGQDPAAT